MDVVRMMGPGHHVRPADSEPARPGRFARFTSLIGALVSSSHRYVARNLRGDNCETNIRHLLETEDRAALKSLVDNCSKDPNELRGLDIILTKIARDLPNGSPSYVLAMGLHAEIANPQHK